ncbi:MAG: hypothetical protein M5U12_01530 [Verrucomicrobia bacterium]|nr:hypothetical protein [Verrucomicrobiota bacterium]
MYVVKDNQIDSRRGHNLRLLLTPANRDLLHAFTNVMSNEELPATVIYNDRRAYYDVGVRLKGSQRGRYSDTRVSFHLAFPPDDLFRDVHPRDAHRPFRRRGCHGEQAARDPHQTPPHPRGRHPRPAG